MRRRKWLRNKYGTHVVVNVDWKPGDESPVANEVLVENTGTAPVGEGSSAGGSSTPQVKNAGGSSTPDLDRSASSTRNLNTRRLEAEAPDPAGVSRTKGLDQKRQGAAKHQDPKHGAPNIRDVTVQNLKDPKALQELYRQAVAIGIACSSGVGELNFFALANRALTRGHRPGALFISNLKKSRTHFITIADEEAGRRMLLELREGPSVRSSVYATTPQRRLSEEEEFVELCIRGAKRHRALEPFALARHARGWTREQWDRAEASYNQTQVAQWYTGEEIYG